MNQEDFLVWLTSQQTVVMDKLALFFTFLGNEEFYFLIIPFIYWCISKQAGFRLLYLFLVSVYINSLIKVNMAIARPVGVDGVHSILIDSAKVGSHYPYDSFPSGHAQGSTTLWGYLAYLRAQPAAWLIAILLIALISFFRLYTGLHWPIDVIGGIMIAILVLYIGIKLEKRISTWSLQVKWALVTAVPFLLFLIFPVAEGAKYAGFLLGAGVAYLLEQQYVQMNTRTKRWKKGIAYLLGMMGIFGLQVGLKVVLPEALLADFIRYGLIGLWGMLLAPWVFVKLKLYTDGKNRNDLDVHPPMPL